ncbi:MAG: Secretion protein HlyD [Candidatus Woesebacteria bacterium GW2011_GWA1_33_30]|uniref:Secretion protein HlyD n=1 Tax=Candidatus Woesebacteria bacterium GW2011_GWA2_33_28 TaxID=1618561 RepID=A0A0G0CWF8_9BACT|nr:MAG: Secretion protein HlyD [Candidatus Woesebacteria bacterium GW2011_GWA2_33_28]KKP48594.1 MAG: Secretion protein HlyD [Candidatus Woesebacteria bacterium GW2011_GWA1_33_30]KKP49733.1 MAG: Secretion protein HlyD [Microgenomates group bacterium GW2011_GWC1_33_32]KKP52350.1 MAG: Secretion protein HlyD [Candidatus Woesebacteria bacterium GW2011_GWB1_33_38]KKP57049.1 MAG: Secretion protein HlyD [Microgenomates group bacterium GW2011_GWD1_33_9]
MMKLIKKKWKLLSVLLIIAIIITFLISKKNNFSLKTATIQKGNISEELILSGDISASNYAKLAYETSGKVSYIGVKEGETVKKGKLLSKLDTTVLNSSYQIALSNLRIYDATAQNILDQVKNHSSDETYSQKDSRTTAEANKDKAYEAVISAKRNLDGASIYAPFNGIVTFVAHPFSGVFVSFGATEIEIIDPTTMYFSVLADQTEVTKLINGQKVQIVLDSFEDKTYEGKVYNISFVPKIGESGSVYSVKVLFSGVNLLDSKFKIAMTGDAKFVTSEKENAFYVPSNFVKQDKNGNFVKLNQKDKLYIKIGIESSDFTEIVGDIEEGLVVYD